MTADRVVRVPVRVMRGAAQGASTAPEPAPQPPEEPEVERRDSTAAEAQAVDWQDRALRLQAEMENYRKRQQRLAEDQVRLERERLLRAFLPVVDDLERALAAPGPAGAEFRRGIELTHRSALRALGAEGVEPIEARGTPFDPSWHDAVATRPGGAGSPPGTVVEVMETGYRIGQQLLRPAKVIVAA